MIRYVVDVGSPTRIDDRRCTDLAALGFRRDGAYRSEASSGEVWVDDLRTTMVAVYRGFGRVMASVHSVLEDGTHVSTEEKGPSWAQAMFGPGVDVPVAGMSFRFADPAGGIAAVLALHREHVAEAQAKHASDPKTGASASAFVDLRNEAQILREPTRRLFNQVGLVLGGLGSFGSFVIGLLQAANGRPELQRWLGIAFVVGLVQFLMGSLFIGPALLRKGILSAPVARSAELERKQRGGVVTSVRPRAPWLFAVLWSIVVGAVVGASLHGAAQLATVLVAFAFSGFGEAIAGALRDRNGRMAHRVTWEIRDGALHVEGERALPLASIAAAIRSDEGTPTLLVVNRRGRVALRLTGKPEDLDALRDELQVERASLPIARDPRALAIFLAPLLAAVVVAFGAPVVASTFYGLAASLVSLSPLLHLLRRPTVDVGIDGIVVGKRFVAFTEIESLRVVGERIEATERSGKRTVVVLAHPGSGAEVERRWTAHLERADARDEAEVVRRRVAIDEVSDEAPYRARVASPEELGAALLDSAEPRSVRVRAARRLAGAEGDEAARIRGEVEGQVLDPDVRQELVRPRQ